MECGSGKGRVVVVVVLLLLLLLVVVCDGGDDGGGGAPVSVYLWSLSLVCCVCQSPTLSRNSPTLSHTRSLTLWREVHRSRTRFVSVDREELMTLTEVPNLCWSGVR